MIVNVNPVSFVFQSWIKMSSQFSFHLPQLLFSLFPFVCSVTLFLSLPPPPISPVPLYFSLFLLSLCQTQCGFPHLSLVTLVWNPLPSSHRQKSHKVKSTQGSCPLSLPPLSTLHTPESGYLLSGRICQCPAEHSQTRGIPSHAHNQGLCEVVARVDWQYLQAACIFWPQTVR